MFVTLGTDQKRIFVVEVSIELLIISLKWTFGLEEVSYFFFEFGSIDSQKLKQIISSLTKN